MIRSREREDPPIEAGVASPPRLAAWRDRAFALVSGVLLALALPPYDQWFVVFVSLTALALLIDRTSRVRRTRFGRVAAAAALGWFFGFGYFLAGLWWIGAAFLVDAERFAWLLPIAVAGLPAGLALFYAAATGLASMAWLRGPGRIVALAAAFAVAEWLRGFVLTGFPWNEIGLVLTVSDPLMQSASLFGLNGLTFVAVFVGAAPAAFAGRDGGRSMRDGVLALALAAALFGAGWGYGANRLARAADASRHGDVAQPILTLVQPAIPQSEKWDPAEREANFQRLVAMSDAAQPPIGEGSLLVWPESAFPFFYQVTPYAVAEIADLLPKGAVLITGALRFEGDPGAAPQDLDVYNSVFVIDDVGDVVDVYDKVRLVPFGEYLPLQGMLEAVGLRQLTQLKGGFVAGRRRKDLRTDGLPPIVPLICYEIIFDLPGRPAEAGRAWILNLTNDAWFGETAGPYQHFRQVRVRAVEEGLPVVRVANTGISAVVDSYGQVLASAPLGARTTLRVALPEALATQPMSSFFRERMQPWIGGFLMLLFVIIGGRREDTPEVAHDVLFSYF